MYSILMVLGCIGSVGYLVWLFPFVWADWIGNANIPAYSGRN